MKPVSVTITSDLLCPWCWVGLRKLQQASTQAAVPVDITWRPYMLRPHAPPEGIPKGGTPESRVPRHLKRAGQAVGIDFTGLTDRTPDSSLFHATMHHLEGHKQQTKFHEAVFEAYFTLGIYPDQEALIKCADSVGVGKTVSAFLSDPEKVKAYSALVREEAFEASQDPNVNGVPTFAFGDDEPAFSGAQDVGMFARYLNHYSAIANNHDDVVAQN